MEKSRAGLVGGRAFHTEWMGSEGVTSVQRLEGSGVTTPECLAPLGLHSSCW
jgi:hypothetical protein